MVAPWGLKLYEDRNTIEDVFEPYLLKEGYLLRTPRGREISSKAIDHLNATISDQSSLIANVKRDMQTSLL